MNVNSYYINSPGTGGESVLNTPKRPSEQRGAFWSALSAACADKPGSSEMLFRDISMIRDPLSQVDIHGMVSDYSSGALTQGQYEILMNALQDLSAVTDGGQPENILSELKERIAGADGDVMEQAKDPDGEFWVNLRRTVMEHAKENHQLRKEDETLAMLNLMLDNLTGRNDLRVSAASGLRLSMSADQDAIKSGYLPSELHTYLLTVASKSPDDLAAEEPAEKVEKVEAAAEAAAEKLYAKSEQRQSLSAGDLADLASRYNPETMGVEEYTGFLEDIVKLGVVSEEEIKSIRSYAAALPFTADILRTPTPMDGDIESWIQNRMLWKPGITRESARRAGLSDDPFAQEEKTLSTIAEILADVRRQRYPSVSL